MSQPGLLHHALAPAAAYERHHPPVPFRVLVARLLRRLSWI